jgi:hypothetical protein
MIHCSINCFSNSAHLSNLFTGFELLRKAGVVTLSQQCMIGNAFDINKPQHLRDARQAHRLVVVNGSVRLYYDNHDSDEIDLDVAERVDYYFKRSYARLRVPDAVANKVLPLGLNYPLYPDSVDDLGTERARAFKQGSSPLNAPEGRGVRSFRSTPANMDSAPMTALPPKVLFITRAWDPFDHKERSDEKTKERIRLNETRASCLGALRQEFGDDFFGGFERTDYAVRNYRELLLQDDEISLKENYIKLLATYPICVSTNGLHRSIGWKMGEYVAFSRAILSERLCHEIPGDFRDGQNYLGFDTARGCVDAARALFADAASRAQIMENNYNYYNEYVEAKMSIQRTLNIGLYSGNRSRVSGPAII